MITTWIKDVLQLNFEMCSCDIRLPKLNHTNSPFTLMYCFHRGPRMVAAADCGARLCVREAVLPFTMDYILPWKAKCLLRDSVRCIVKWCKINTPQTQAFSDCPKRFFQKNEQVNFFVADCGGLDGAGLYENAFGIFLFSTTVYHLVWLRNEDQEMLHLLDSCCISRADLRLFSINPHCRPPWWWSADLSWLSPKAERIYVSLSFTQNQTCWMISHMSTESMF